MERSKLYSFALEQVQDSNPAQISIIKNMLQIYDQSTDPIPSVWITSQKIFYFSLFLLFLNFVISVSAFQFSFNFNH